MEIKTHVLTNPQDLSPERKLQARKNIDLGNVNNTSDMDKPISTATQAALDTKVDKVDEAVADNLAAFDDERNVTDSGITGESVVDALDKLSGISDGANKVEASTTNGKIKIDGEDTTVYTHPTTTVHSAGAYTVGKSAGRWLNSRLRRRRLGMILTHGANSIGGGGSILPEGYQQLKSIHFKGTTDSRLYTTYGVFNTYRIELKGKVRSFSSGGMVLNMGSNAVIQASSSDQYIRVKNTDNIYMPYDNTYDKSILLNDFTMTLDKTQFTVNNESPITLTYYSSVGGQMWLSSITQASNNYDLYSVKFINTDNGTTVYHFIPCKEISTGRYGLYEIIYQGFTLGTNVAP